MITLKDAPHNIETQTNFNAGNLTGLWEVGENGFCYVIRSYNAIIAIYYTALGGEYWVTDTKYSVTTSKHLNIVKRAWGLI